MNRTTTSALSSIEKLTLVKYRVDNLLNEIPRLYSSGKGLKEIVDAEIFIIKDSIVLLQEVIGDYEDELNK